MADNRFATVAIAGDDLEASLEWVDASNTKNMYSNSCKHIPGVFISQ